MKSHLLLPGGEISPFTPSSPHLKGRFCALGAFPSLSPPPPSPPHSLSSEHHLRLCSERVLGEDQTAGLCRPGWLATALPVSECASSSSPLLLLHLHHPPSTPLFIPPPPAYCWLGSMGDWGADWQSLLFLIRSHFKVAFFCVCVCDGPLQRQPSRCRRREEGLK